MQRLLTILVFILALWGAYWWWGNREIAPPSSQEEQQEQQQAAPPAVVEVEEPQKETVEEEEEEEEEQIEEAADADPEESRPAPSWGGHKVDTALPEEKEFVADASVWTQKVRIFAGHIQALILVEKGASVESIFGKHEDPPDLHEIYADLSEEADAVDLPSTCDEAAEPMEDILQRLEAIMEPLSDSPLLAELESVEPLGRKLVNEVNKLYVVMNNYCQ
jgi:hypothetical protein